MVGGCLDCILRMLCTFLLLCIFCSFFFYFSFVDIECSALPRPCRRIMPCMPLLSCWQLHAMPLREGGDEGAAASGTADATLALIQHSELQRQSGTSGDRRVRRIIIYTLDDGTRVTRYVLRGPSCPDLRIIRFLGGFCTPNTPQCTPTNGISARSQTASVHAHSPL